MQTRIIKFLKKEINILYRDDSDLSVIEEIFVDKMYRSVESIISNIKYSILDIGAHIGLFSIYASILNPNARIIALEPEPENFKLMKENLELNDIKNVTALQFAVIPSESRQSRDDERSLANDTTKLYLSDDSHNHSTVVRTGRDLSLQETCMVPAITLPDLIKQNNLSKIGLLKMDIEGAEFEIIKNMFQDTWDKIQNIVVEYHPDAENTQNKLYEILSNIIRTQGFSVEHFPNKFDKKIGLLVARNKSRNVI